MRAGRLPDRAERVVGPTNAETERERTNEHPGRREDTVEFFNLVLGVRLNEQEKKDVVAFMRVLKSPERAALLMRRGEVA